MDHRLIKSDNGNRSITALQDKIVDAYCVFSSLRVLICVNNNTTKCIFAINNSTFSPESTQVKIQSTFSLRPRFSTESTHVKIASRLFILLPCPFLGNHFQAGSAHLSERSFP